MYEPANADRAGGVATGRASTRRWYLLLVVPLIGTLIPPIYNRKHPTVIGVPFFYWYLMLWVPLSAACLVVVYWFTREDDQ